MNFIYTKNIYIYLIYFILCKMSLKSTRGPKKKKKKKNEPRCDFPL